MAALAEKLFVLCRHLAGLMLVTTVAVVTLELITRNFLGFSLQLSEEYGGYLLVAMSFLGYTDSFRTGALMRIEFIYESVPAAGRLLLDLLYDLCALAAVAVLFWHGFRLVRSSFVRGSLASTQMETPLWIPQLVIPVGLAVLMLALVLSIAATSARLMRRA